MTADQPTAAERVANAGITANDYRHEPLYPNGKPVVHVDWTPGVRRDHAELRAWIADPFGEDEPDQRGLAIQHSIRQLLAERDARA